MAFALYLDVHIDRAIADQLRLRQVEVLTVQEDGSDQLTDASHLDRASQLGRPLVTHDIHFHALAQSWQQHGRPFCGLIFAHQMQVPIGRCVQDLELIAKASEQPDWVSAVLRLPL